MHIMSEAYYRAVRLIKPICSEKNFRDLMVYINSEERQNYISDLIETGSIKTEQELIRTVVEKYFVLRPDSQD